MAWNVSSIMDQKMEFVVLAQKGIEPFRDLCERFDISRKTGYKWVKRYQQFGPRGLDPRSPLPFF